MKFFRHGPPGRERPGIVDASGVLRDLGGDFADLSGEALSPERLAAYQGRDLSALPVVPGGTRIGACVGDVSNFVAVGLNYRDHARETGAAIPDEPILFNKAPSCIVGPNDDVRLPPGSETTDWEVELAIVMGRPAWRVPEAEALDHVAGLCICHDVSERTYQNARGGQWMKGKGCPTFGPLGPWLVTPDEIRDLRDLDMWLDVNGAPMQRGTTAEMIFGVEFLVAYVSEFMLLRPGDVITTGTPPGVGLGRKPPVYLKAGDVVTLGIAGLGEQRQRIVAEDAG